jgi:hypothetical protein
MKQVLFNIPVILFALQGIEAANEPTAPIPFTNYRRSTDDSNSDDELPTSSSPGNAITKIVERYGNCMDRRQHRCLWYHVKVNHHGNPLLGGAVDSSNYNSKNPACLEKHLFDISRKDPNFMKYLQKRFYILRDAQKYVQNMKNKMQSLLVMHETQPIQAGKHHDKIIAYIDGLLRAHQEGRLKRHHRMCQGLIAYFIRDVNTLLNRMRKRELSTRDTIKTWLDLNYKQKRKLYKILLLAQKRDMYRLLRLRNLKLWYTQKLHLLDVQSQRQMHHVLFSMHERERCFQHKLWLRMGALQNSANHWTLHELAYKRALLALSKRQQYLLNVNMHQNQKLDYLTKILEERIVPMQMHLTKKCCNRPTIINRTPRFGGFYPRGPSYFGGGPNYPSLPPQTTWPQPFTPGELEPSRLYHNCRMRLAHHKRHTLKHHVRRIVNRTIHQRHSSHRRNITSRDRSRTSTNNGYSRTRSYSQSD